MKVIQATPRYPPRSGGVETHVREVSERLADRGHDVTVVTADAADDVRVRTRTAGVAVHRCRGIAPADAYHLSLGIGRVVRRHSTDADVVHAHNYHSFVPPVAAVAARCPFVVTPHYHGASADSLRDRLLSAYAPLGGRVLRSADGCIAVSDWERERLGADFGVEAETVPNGIDVARFAPDDRDRGESSAPLPTGADGDRPYLLSVGRLEPYKGVHHVIAALAALPEYDLVVAGGGEENYRSKLVTVAEEADVADRVSFLGYVDEDQLPALYAGAAVYVTLSSFEAFGMTVGEALASGTPCVVLTARALADWTDYAGVVGVTGTDPENVADAVVRARATDPDPAELPTWEGTVDGIESVYGTL